jgi:hypothetical protein
VSRAAMERVYGFWPAITEEKEVEEEEEEES